MRNAKIDNNQPEIVKTFRRAGATVTCTHMVGKGFPDLVVGYRGVNLLVEVKNEQASKGPKLTSDQIIWHNEWVGTVHIIKNATEALNLLNEVCKNQGMLEYGVEVNG
jgi:Holliday junction resolvase